MASVIRCGQLVSGHLTTIQRQSVQLNKCRRILNVMPILGRESNDIQRRCFNSQWEWQKNQQQKPFGYGIFELISIGCVSIALYNWKKYANGSMCCETGFWSHHFVIVLIFPGFLNL